MVVLGHTAQLESINGNRTLQSDPHHWGSLLAKAEYLSQFQPVKAWQIEIQPDQLSTQSLEQLAAAVAQLSSHKLFAELEWLSLKIPGDINQDKWRPFFLLLQVLTRYTGRAAKNISFQITEDLTLPQLWRLTKKHELEQTIKTQEGLATDLLSTAYRYRDQIDKSISLTIENNPPYLMSTHSFSLVGNFPVTLKRWQLTGVDFGLNISHAALACWYREQYGHDGPIPSMNTHHRAMIADFWHLDPKYLKLSGLMNTPESFTHSLPIGSHRDDIDWELWLADLPTKTKAQKMPCIIDLVSNSKPDQWPLCQASSVFLQRFL